MRALAVGVAVLIVLGFAGATGRAVPGGNYRPTLPPAALENGCHPLPAGLRLDFPYEVRHDDVERGTRTLLLHYDLLDEQAVRQRLAASFQAAGLAPRPGSGYALPDGGEIRAEVRPFDVPADSIVRGEVRLVLPEAPPTSAEAVCDRPSSTKRFSS